METTPKHRADRPEREETGTFGVFINPHATCTGSNHGQHHTRPCPMHHPGSYAKCSPRRWKHRGGRQAVAS